MSNVNIIPHQFTYALRKLHTEAIFQYEDASFKTSGGSYIAGLSAEWGWKAHSYTARSSLICRKQVGHKQWVSHLRQGVTLPYETKTRLLGCRRRNWNKPNMSVTLHHFPNPETSTEKFKNWISNIGGDITELDADVIFRNRRVCSRHFEDIYKYPTNRLSRIAVPSLHLTSGYSQDNAVGHDSKKEEKYSRKRKAPHLSLKQHKKYKLLLKQLEKSNTEKDNFRKKYLLARKMKKTEAFQIITKHMSKSAKIFCHMQVIVYAYV
ncbi:hypothetical protein PYW08_013086 [Mythimna loreyi]|uniref:Uncharacterized protein n=1 Tax=Mythimna loreyi TaxID=667449 RepID=A0ACC2PZ80_9NEOP|nr:hypothetical protein PYW08_013086 [Mythimna loreyi]